MESFENGAFKTTSMSGYVGRFDVKWFPPEAAERLTIKCLFGKSTGVSGLELDMYSRFGLFDGDGREVVSFGDSYFGNAGGTEDDSIREVLVLEADRLLIIRRSNGAEERRAFAPREG